MSQKTGVLGHSSGHPLKIPSMNRRDEEFHIALSLCRTVWAEIENELFTLFSLSLHASPEQEAIIFFRTPTLDARLSLTDELLRTLLPKPDNMNGGHPHPHVKTWEGLANRIRNGLSFRNRLAHWPIYEIWKTKPGRVSVRTDDYEKSLETNISTNEFPRKKLNPPQSGPRT